MSEKKVSVILVPPTASEVASPMPSGSEWLMNTNTTAIQCLPSVFLVPGVAGSFLPIIFED